MPIAATCSWSPTRSRSIGITSRTSPDRSAASHSFSFAVLSATKRRDTEDFVVARLAWPARSPSGRRIERAYLRVATPPPRQNHSCSFDHLVGEQLHRVGNREAQRLRRLAIDQ